jgi:hypothetical protein
MSKYILLHNNCDGYPDACASWKERPNRAQLADAIEDYVQPAKQVQKAVEDIVTTGQADIQDSACTTFELQEV